MDIAWGLGFVGIALWMEVFYPLESRWLLTSFVTIYGLRLATFLYYRNKDKDEDWRYANWRKQWGKYALLRSYFQVFILQGFFLLIISISIISPQLPPDILDIKIYLGTVIFLIGFAFESISDYQLLQFKQSNPPLKWDYEQRVMEIFTPSQLFWRNPYLVGIIFNNLLALVGGILPSSVL